MRLLNWRARWSYAAIACLGAVLGSTLASPASAYSGPAAATYADAWAFGRNSGYPNFGGQDCTNFVSQSLASGGFRHVGGSNSGSLYEWWIRRNIWGSWDYATTWSAAPRLKAFLKNDVPGGTDMGTAWGGSTNAYTPNSVVTGDVLFYDWGLGEGISHAAIQTGIGNDANYLWWGNFVDYHSNDTKHRFWSLKPSNPYWQSTTVYFVHIWPGN